MTKNEEFEFIRKRQRNLIPFYMIDYENKRLEQSLPDPAILSRQDYMISGFALLDDFFLKDDLNIDATLKEFSDLSILSLKTAFE